MNIILASSSVHRKTQLSQLGVQHTSIAPDIDETNVSNLPAKELAIDLAKKKAEKVAELHQGIIISGDQTAEIDNRILGKPGSVEGAIAQLNSCSGKDVIFYSALSVCNTTTGTYLNDVIETRVTFRKLTNQQISAYVAIDNPISCAGSFKSESLGIALFEKICSQDPSALIGLPLITLTNMLASQGVEVLSI